MCRQRLDNGNSHRTRSLAILLRCLRRAILRRMLPRCFRPSPRWLSKHNRKLLLPSPPRRTLLNRPPNVAQQLNMSSAQSNGQSVPPPMPQPPASIPPASLPFTSTPPNANGMPAFPGLPGQLHNAYPAGMFANTQQQQQPAQTGFPQFNVPQQLQAPQMSMEQLTLLQLLLQQPALQGNPAAAAQALQALLGAAGQTAQMPPTMADQQQYWQGNAPQPQAPVDTTRGTDSYAQEQRGRERGYSPPPRSPPRYGGARRGGRSRSRSPGRFGRDEPRSPPSFRRRSPVYGEYEGNNTDSARGGRENERGRGGGRGRAGRRAVSPRRRDRSPPGRVTATGAQATPPPRGELPKVPKNVTLANDIGPSSVRGTLPRLRVFGTVADRALYSTQQNFVCGRCYVWASDPALMDHLKLMGNIESVRKSFGRYSRSMASYSLASSTKTNDTRSSKCSLAKTP
jgi:hypothetical protein